MKKLFLWYSGTDTEAKDMRNFFNIAETDTIKVDYIDGLGTDGNLLATQTLQGKEPKNKTKILTPVLDAFFKTKTTIYGAQEHDQLAQILHTFEIIDKINSDDKEVELIIGGHSRGAAIGILGLIASLYATSKTHSFKDSLIKKIIFIAVDPVPGSPSNLASLLSDSKNDLLGFETIEGKNKIKTALDFIATKSEKPNLFKVIYYPARFDARNEFKGDDYWLEFYKNQMEKLKLEKLESTKSKIDHPLNEPVIETKFYIGGFRHSAMVDKTEEISALYDEVNCPTNLLKEIVNQELGLSRTSVNTIQKKIKRTEHTAISSIANITKLQNLLNLTHKDAYDYGRLLHGNSLQEKVEGLTKNHSFTVKLSKEIQINNRYLGR